MALVGLLALPLGAALGVGFIVWYGNNPPPPPAPPSEAAAAAEAAEAEEAAAQKAAILAAAAESSGGGVRGGGSSSGSAELRHRLVATVGGEAALDKAVADATAEAARREAAREASPPSTTDSMRYGLDACFLAAILAGAFLILLYEVRMDPYALFLDLFPRETSALTNALARFRSDWWGSSSAPPPPEL